MRTVRSYGPTSEAIPAARHYVNDVLKGIDPDDAYAVELMVSELATNCVRHGGTRFSMVVDLSADEVRVEVTDSGPGTPTVQSPSPTEPTGRGLRIVATLSHTWGVETVSDQAGKTVWFTYRLLLSTVDDPVDRLGLDVQATQEPGNDFLLGAGSDDRHRDHKLTGQPTDSPSAIVDHYELRAAMESPRVCLGSEVELSRIRALIDACLLGPGQLSFSQQATGQRVEAAYELVPQADNRNLALASPF